MSLAEFLLARIAEDEAAALIRGKEGMTQRLRDQSEEIAKLYGDPDPPEDDVKLADTLWFNAQDVADYADRFDPVWVLAECEAKRRIVEVHASGGAWCDHCNADRPGDAADSCPTIQLLALPYADHPDYQQEWRP
jgi:hypothetical protein